jgi:SAM-dependent methyltransferase
MSGALRHLIPAQLRRFLREQVLAGDTVHCPLCNRGSIAFLPMGTPPRPHVMCPFCGSFERTRMMALALKERGLPRSGDRVLHVAPDRSLRSMLSALPITYMAGDRMEPGYSYPPGTEYLDITAIPYPDDHFDLIICSHVLEHVADDRRAMRELYRVLGPGGLAILLVPMSTAPITDEDPAITDPDQRRERFGQFDHVRLYGRDYFDRLRAAGFTVTVERTADRMGYPDMFRYGLKADEELVTGTKPTAAGTSRH